MHALIWISHQIFCHNLNTSLKQNNQLNSLESPIRCVNCHTGRLQSPCHGIQTKLIHWCPHACHMYRVTVCLWTKFPYTCKFASHLNARLLFQFVGTFKHIKMYDINAHSRRLYTCLLSMVTIQSPVDTFGRVFPVP